MCGLANVFSGRLRWEVDNLVYGGSRFLGCCSFRPGPGVARVKYVTCSWLAIYPEVAKLPYVRYVGLACLDLRTHWEMFYMCSHTLLIFICEDASGFLRCCSFRPGLGVARVKYVTFSWLATYREVASRRYVGFPRPASLVRWS